MNTFEKNRLFEVVSVYMRVRKQTVGHHLLQLSDLHSLSNNPDLINNSFMFMKTIRGTVANWKDVLFNLLAMIRNIGCPTLFMTLSANDYYWPELANSLNVPIEELPFAVQKNPLFTAIHFERRWRALLRHVINNSSNPLGKVHDYFARIEFQARGSPHLHIFFLDRKYSFCI